MGLRSLICSVTDHDWRYNFPNMPSKRICARCKMKVRLDMHDMVWSGTFVDKFNRSDKELIKLYFKNIS